MNIVSGSMLMMIVYPTWYRCEMITIYSIIMVYGTYHECTISLQKSIET